MKTFFCKLIPPRPLFGQDLTEVEMIAMREHITHWTQAMEAGKVIAFGPVADPKGFWGAGIVQVESDAELEEFTAKDPVMLAGLGFRHETYLMPQIMIRAGVSEPENVALQGS